jgi:hypothetical protein
MQSSLSGSSVGVAGVCANIESRAALNDGNTIPWLGLGVYQSKAGSETEDAVYMALHEGSMQNLVLIIRSSVWVCKCRLSTY